MIKFIKYHLLYLFNNLWLVLAFIMCIVSLFLFFYLGNGFDSGLLRLLESEVYLKEFESEAFLVSNMVLSIWIIGASKEMFIVDDPHIMVINKKFYVKSKILAYLLYYMFISVLIYGMYQVVVFMLYGVVKYNYSFLIHLLLNVLLIHLLVVLLSGNNKNILVMMIYIVCYLIFSTILRSEFYLKGALEFFMPYLSLSYPSFGYLHILLMSLLIYYLGSFKHISNYV